MVLKHFFKPLWICTYPQAPCQLSGVGCSIHSHQEPFGSPLSRHGHGDLQLGRSLPPQHPQPALSCLLRSLSKLGLDHPSYAFLPSTAEKISSLYRFHPNFPLFLSCNSKKNRHHGQCMLYCSCFFITRR